MISKRGKQIVIRSQFNIHGSRGKSVKPFITDYVSREEACDTSMAYLPPDGVRHPGDGYAFTFQQSAISRKETLRLADAVEDYFLQGNRAIQQMVVSFSPDYLVKQGIVEKDAAIFKRGDYRYQYDDIRLRHAIRSGMQALADAENYRDPQMVACIQHDTLHLHVHIVLYENYPDVSRMRGKEERGVIKPSSFNQFTYEVDRKLTMTKSQAIPNAKKLGVAPTVQEAHTAPTTPTKDAHPLALPSNQWIQYVQLFQQLMAQQEEETLSEEEEVTHTPPELEEEIQRLVQETVSKPEEVLESEDEINGGERLI